MGGPLAWVLVEELHLLERRAVLVRLTRSYADIHILYLD
jgi:hypothetical protein